jgi:hypothetical protein
MDEAEWTSRILASSQRGVSRLGPRILAFLIGAAGAMATARYWPLAL